MTADTSTGAVWAETAMRRCCWDGTSQGRLVTVDSQGRELASLDIDEEVMSLSAAGKYVAVLYQDHLTIYDKDLQEYAVLKDVSAAGTVLMRSDGSAVLTGASAASLYLP